MPVMPYSPMAQPEKHVTQDRMKEILERNSGKPWPTATKEEAAPKDPPRPAGKLEWEDRLRGSMGRYTKCHWYSCCQIGQGESATFEVWTRQPLTGGMKQFAVGLKTFREAIDVAQKDADEHHARGER
jgi:hypothetical protein